MYGPWSAKASEMNRVLFFMPCVFLALDAQDKTRPWICVLRFELSESGPRLGRRLTRSRAHEKEEEQAHLLAGLLRQELQDHEGFLIVTPPDDVQHTPRLVVAATSVVPASGAAP